MNGAGAQDRGRRRRALALGGLALVLGGLAAADMAGRERALRERIGEPVGVLVTRSAVEAGDRLRPRDLAIREVPARYAPRGALHAPAQVAGLRAAVAIPADSEILAGMVADGRAPAPGAPVRRGERVAELVAVASPELVQPGVRVDVVVSGDEQASAGAGTTLALQDVEVLRARPADGGEAGGERVAASLRVSLRQAVYLAAAQGHAREVRLLPRAAGDRRRVARTLSVGADLRLR